MALVVKLPAGDEQRGECELKEGLRRKSLGYCLKIFKRITENVRKLWKYHSTLKQLEYHP